MDLHFLSPGDPGERTGGHIYNRRVLQALAHQGCHAQQHVLPGAWPEPDGDALESARACLAALPDRALVVIDGLALGGMPALLETEAERLRLVALMHLPLAAETGIERARLQARAAAETRALAACQRIIANSWFTREQLVLRGFAEGMIDVARPGTDPAPLARGCGEPVTLVSVASVTPRKGQDLLVEALVGLADVDWRCDIVGSLERDPAFVDAVRARIAAAGLDDRVALCGELAGEELAAAWDRADVAVLASRYEGFGMVITEAVARGLPVVATAGGAVAEALPAGAGILANPGDITALRAALFDVIRHADRRAGLAAGARAARPELSTWAATAAHFRKALERVDP